MTDAQLKALQEQVRREVEKRMAPLHAQLKEAQKLITQNRTGGRS